MPLRHFCTYFDHRYLPRGLTLIRSLRRYHRQAQFHILALDEKCRQMLDALAIPGVQAIALAELEAFDPELPQTRANRTLIEYYFTCTSCFPRYLLHTRPQIDLLTYLDADIQFFASPEIVFSAIGAASIAITPHRFSPERLALARYGVYNVGWVSWRNDATGRRCLDDYRADCLDWCHDRLEGERFADQKYLDKWPGAYPNVCVLEHPGVNAASWNINNYRVRTAGDTVLLSGHPLVFWHHSALREQPNGRWSVALDGQSKTWHPALLEQVINPYLQDLNGAIAELEARFGAYREDTVHIRYSPDRPHALASEPVTETAPPPPSRAPSAIPASQGYRLISGEQARAIAADGWQFEDVAHAQARAYEHLIAQMKAGQPRHDLALAAALVRSLPVPSPRLLEVGCGSGYYSEVFQHLLPQGVQYTGIDYSQAMIDLARQRYPATAFQVADATRLPFPDRAFDIVFNGVSLMHVLDYEAAIREARRVAARYVIFHTAVLRQAGPPRYLLKQAYGRPVVEVILSEAELRLLLAKYGLYVAASAESIPYDLSAELGEPTYTRSLVCALTPGDAQARPALLNLGCGGHFHPGWVNVDVQAAHPCVMAFNILSGIPFADATFDAVYHSHMLEHLPVWQAPAFMAECARVLRPGGVLRVAIPDLETICRLYLANLDAALGGDPEAEGRYDWMLLELLDQMARSESGGQMARHWRRPDMPAEPFVIERVGTIAEAVRRQVRQSPNAALPAPPKTPTPEELGRFRLGGEVHQWMYDRFSLARLMRQAGLTHVETVGATDSAIPGFARYQLDADDQGRVRKPDSLFMEGRRVDKSM